MDFNWFFQKKHVLLALLSYLLDAVIGFGYCNHWNLAHNILLDKEKSYVQLVWNRYYCIDEILICSSTFSISVNFQFHIERKCVDKLDYYILGSFFFLQQFQIFRTSMQ